MNSADLRRKATFKRYLSFRLPEVDLNEVYASDSDIHKCGSAGSPFLIGTGLVLKNTPHRRDSFLYKDQAEQSSAIKRTSFHSVDKLNQPINDEVFITPFAQIIARIKRIRNLFLDLTAGAMNDTIPEVESDNNNESKNQGVITHQLRDNRILAFDSKLIPETLRELNAILEMLDKIQSQRSISSLMNAKLKHLLSIGLTKSGFADESGSVALASQSRASPIMSNRTAGKQISNYINQFFDPADDLVNKLLPSEAYELPFAVQKFYEEEKAGAEYSAKKRQSSNLSIDEPQTQLTFDQPLHSANDDWEELNKETESGLGVVAESDDILFKSFKFNTEKIRQQIDKEINCWNFDIFDLESETKGKTLTVLGFEIFKERDLLAKFKISSQTLFNCLHKIENLYHSSVPYHNSTHAVDVMQSAHVLLSSQCLQMVYSDLEVFATLFACAIHDADHPGVNNQFLIRTENALALLYNDQSVLENHHLSVGLGAIHNDPDCDILNSLSTNQRQAFRKMVIDLVLATDMSKHMTLLADLKTTVESKKASGSSVINLDNYSTRILLLQNLVHVADLGNTTKSLSIYQKWVDRITVEFFAQGDKEHKLNLEISAMCDKSTVCIPSSQVSFMDFITHPLWETWSELVYPDGQEMLEGIRRNREYYANVKHSCSVHKSSSDES